MQSWDLTRVVLGLIRAGAYEGAGPLLPINSPTLRPGIQTLERDVSLTLFIYVATLHDLQSVQQVGSEHSVAVNDAMREMPFTDGMLNDPASSPAAVARWVSCSLK